MMGGGTSSAPWIHLTTASRLHEATLWQVAPGPLPATETLADSSEAALPASIPAPVVGLNFLAPLVLTGVANHAPPVVAPPPAAAVPVCGIGCFQAFAPQTARIVASASFPAKRVVAPGSVTLIPVGTAVVLNGYVDNCNGRWYRLSDNVSWVHESALAGAVAPPRMVCSA